MELCELMEEAVTLYGELPVLERGVEGLDTESVVVERVLVRWRGDSGGVIGRSSWA